MKKLYSLLNPADPMKNVFSTSRVLHILCLSALLSLGAATAWGTVGAYYISGFEGATESAWTATSGTVSLTNEVTARTGSKSGEHNLEQRNSQKQANFYPTIAYKGGQYIYAIGYVRKANATLMNSCLIDIYIGGIVGTPASPTLTNDWQRFWVGGQKSGTTDYNSVRCRIRDKCTNDKTGSFVIYLDDAIMYVSDQNKVDLKKPGSATSASATTSLISWTNGTDAADGSNGVTGVQKTLIFHRTSGSSDDLTLNDQGWYSLTSTEGPSSDQSGHWTLISASVAADATSYAGTFVAGDRYAIVHRDLAFNYSTPTYVTAIADACVPPTSVSIDGAWDYFGGETISLTATAYDDSDDEIDAGDITGYQWEKLISSTWTPLTNGTTDGVTISGATTANLQIDNCGFGNSGKYRCVVSTGAACSTASATAIDGSQGFGVKVYALKDNTSGTPVYREFTRTGSSQSGSLTIDMAANTDYKFKVQADIEEYGNNGTICHNETNWVCSTSDGYLTVKSGMGGTVTISMDYSTGGNNSNLGVPEISVTYPNRTVYMALCSDWNQAGAQFSIYYWNNADGSFTQWTDFMTPVACNNSVVAVDVPVWADRYIFVRLNNTATSGNWTDKWNQTVNVTPDPTKDYYYNMSGVGDSYSGTWGTYTPPTYTITFNGNGNTGGSMSNMTGIACGSSATLTANAYTKTGSIFDVWNTAADGSGTVYPNGSIITNVTGNITLYAQWDNEDCDVIFQGAACGPEASPTFSATIGSVTIYHNTPASSTPNYTYLSSDGYIWLTPASGTYFSAGDKIKAIVYNQSSGTTYTTGFRIGSNSYTASIPPSSYQTIVHTLIDDDIVDGKIKVLRGIPGSGYGCFVSIRVFDCDDTEPTPSGVVDIPGTVDKDNVASYSGDMTWYGASNEYFDFGPADGSNTGRWVEWNVNLLYSAQYTVTEIFDVPGTGGHEWQLELLDGSRNVVATYNTTRVWEAGGERTDAAKWDLRGIDPDIYILRVTNAFPYAQPKLKSITLYCEPPTPIVIVDIPGTVNKSNVDSYSVNMTFWEDDLDYFDFGPQDAANLDRWAVWNVNLLASGNYIVTEEWACSTGRGWQIELLDDEDNVLSTYSTGDQEGASGVKTYDAPWNLSAIAPGVYKLRVTNVRAWARPKLKRITLGFGGLSVSYTKIPNQTLYGRAGDSSRAYGEINDATVATTGIVPGSTVSVSGNVLTIGSVTITAPDSTRGTLHDIPATGGGVVPPSGCDWRFDHWEHVPTTAVTGDIDSIRAVYFPTFNVDYNTNGGTINDPEPYTHWYPYTGIEADWVPLPVDVTKPGYTFAGWYQESTTELFTTLTCNYYGDYSKGESCYSDACDYRLKAHWVLPCDEPQIISKVTVTGSGTTNFTYEGYNNKEYAGTPVVSVGSTTAAFDIDGNGSNETGYMLAADDDIVFATIKTGTTFRVGDRVLVAVTQKNTNRTIDGGSNTNMLTLYYGTGAGDARLLVNLKVAPTPPDTWEGIYEYTLDADDVLDMTAAGATGVGVWRDPTNGENPCVYSVAVIGCRDLVFDDNHGTHVWSDPQNWAPTYTEIPSYYQATRILKPCVVDIPDAHAKIVKLCRESTGHDGRLDIQDTAALVVIEPIYEVRGIDYTTTYDVAASNLIVRSTATHQGALVHGDAGSHTHATIEFYGRGSGYPAANATWQYMGVPFSDAVSRPNYENSEMCQWIENTAGNAGWNWRYVGQYEPLTPFVGYALSNPAAKTFTFSGTLTPSANQTLSLTCAGTTGYTGWNMFANSWMAPINISHFIASDFGEAQATIYLFNTGTNDGTQATQPETTAAGQYVAVPIASAGSMLVANRYIPPMQGFYIVTETPTSVTLNYDRLVRNPEGSEDDPISILPNRAPRRVKPQEDNDTQMPRIIIDVEGSRFYDRLYIFENTDQTNGFDNAWDGYKLEGETYAPQLMTRTGDLDLAVDVSPSFGGKRIAFRPGEDNEYTLHFSTTEEGLRLRDLLTQQETDITEGGTFSFLAFNEQIEERFEIVDYRHVIGITTDLDKLYDGPIGEILEMAIYTTDGRLVEQRTTGFNKPLNLPQTGIYIVRLKTTAGMQVHKIKF